MSKIQILSPLLANQIAAGECIERPSSVVKELLENSLDAQAKNIQIDIEDAGNRLILVSDDGCGMDAEDLPLALTRHATSKISSSKDLMNIMTLGFRGEALASIASISEVAISSATKDSQGGHRLECHNGDLKPLKPVGMAKGTIIEVRNLFYNVPARRKFLKAKATEMAHITEVVTQLALSAYTTGFKLTHNGKTIFSLTATQDARLRVKELLGPEEIEFLYAEQSFRNCQLRAYLGLPCYTRSSNKAQYCYINGRAVKDRVILRALQDAYQDYLPQKRFPIAVLYLGVQPEYVDVNVHPAKAEVRYRESKDIYEIVFKTALQGLNSKEVLTPLPLQEFSATENVHNIEETKESEEVLKQPEQQDAFWRQASSEFVSSEPKEIYPDRIFRPKERSISEKHPKNFIKPQSFPREEQQTFSIWEKEEKTIPRIGASLFLQIKKSYLVAEIKDGIIIIDQHALHERMIYNRLREQVQKGKVISQQLLFPETLSLSAEEIALFLEWQKDLENMGIETKCNGNSIEIRSLPQVLGKICAKDILSDLLASSEDRKKLKLEDALEKILATMACKAAIKAGELLTNPEIESLIKAYQEGDENVFYCPHGRPAILKISIHELEKHFKRT